ncbi:MAG: methionyl-tRNA formyltransferase [Rhodospirillaceae bacterium]|nr:methionyl-tRNA formyltransferase [Rhodospirillaceae bacterium]
MNNKPSQLRLGYMGSPDFSVPALASLINANHNICVVYTQPPRPGGRGKNLQKTPVHNFAEEHGILVRTPGSLKTQESEEMLLALDLDALVVAAYGLILPQKILQIPKLGCLNIHASILPRWRGAAPIQRAIMAGDGESGVCIMLMEKGLDTGPILKSETIILDDDTTGASLHDSLASIGAKLISPTLIDFADGKIEPTYQNDRNAVYAKKLSKEDGHLVWSKSAEELERIVRALNPWPGAWCLMNGERIKIHEASVLNTLQHTQDPGKILTGDFSVACGIGVLKITAIQQPGKSAMGVSDFIRGNPIQIGSTLL